MRFREAVSGTRRGSQMQPHRVADEAALADKITEIAAAVSPKPPSYRGGYPRAVGHCRSSAGKEYRTSGRQRPRRGVLRRRGHHRRGPGRGRNRLDRLLSGGPRRRLASLAVPVAIAVVRATRSCLTCSTGSPPCRPTRRLPGPRLRPQQDRRHRAGPGHRRPRAREQHVIVVG